jgi:2-polyprenyl-3-methyl-5-hydroxy-6-metoxy-1,4-benzoquinol methylase
MDDKGMNQTSHYVRLAACYARGALVRPELTDDAAIAAAMAAGLRLHRFKRTAELPRVQRALGALRGFAPSSILDVGSGRGTFLWPLLDAMPDVPVTSIDINPRRVEQLAQVRRGGWTQLDCACMDATAIGFTTSSFDVVTLLEVLEHLPAPEAAAAEAVRVARSSVVLSVPSRADENPEHLHLLAPERLESMFVSAGARRISFTYVPGHLVGVAVCG